MASAVLSAGLLAAGAASAGTYVLDVSSGAASFNQSFAANSSFSDDYLFSIGAGTIGDPTGNVIAGTVRVGSSKLDNVSFSAISFFKVNGDGSHTTISTTIDGHDFFPLSSLVAGNYGFNLTGATSLANKAGSYGGNLTLEVSPVPEPATYGMLLGGLGLVGAMARRKKASQA
ncbi:PEP-CTERM sorting domain-containing protein [Duganella callida]|uniref:PEP-CTERM sorting domain-containing protein n=2 Tax=Duganella callida TaxID=2561932 RepID=A0A4Y9SYA2_9BURK|nr:PEP-CTERM sorting domain-containing protein [Duganella callida]